MAVSHSEIAILDSKWNPKDRFGIRNSPFRIRHSRFRCRNSRVWHSCFRIPRGFFGVRNVFFGIRHSLFGFRNGRLRRDHFIVQTGTRMNGRAVTSGMPGPMVCHHQIQATSSRFHHTVVFLPDHKAKWLKSFLVPSQGFRHVLSHLPHL